MASINVPMYQCTILYVYIDVLFCNLYSSFCTQLYFHPMFRAFTENRKTGWNVDYEKTKIGRSVFLEIVKDPMTRFKGPKGSSLGSMVQIYFLRLIDLHSTHLKYLKKIYKSNFFCFSLNLPFSGFIQSFFHSFTIF